MKIAITSSDGAHVTGHAGHCRRFWLYTLDNGEVRERALVDLGPGETFHASHHRIPQPLEGMAVLVAGGIGAGLRTRLGAAGIGVVSTDEVDVERVIAKVAAGRVDELQTRADACACSCGDGHPH